MSTKGRSDYYAPGDYNACCDRCCAKFKASKLKRDWRGFMLCEWCWEPRHPQDFVRGLADPTPVPWTRQCSHDNIVTFCMTPTASFTVVVDPDNPLKINYASTTPASEACPVTCEYDFGDGETSTSCSGSHTYAAGGTYTVDYTATNPGGSATASASVTIVEPPPPEPCDYLIYGSSLASTLGFYGGSGSPPRSSVDPSLYPAYLTFTNINNRAVATNPASFAYETPFPPPNGNSSYLVNLTDTTSSINIDVSAGVRCVRFKISAGTSFGIIIEGTIGNINSTITTPAWTDLWTALEYPLDPDLNGIATKIKFSFTGGSAGGFVGITDLELRGYTP